VIRIAERIKNKWVWRIAGCAVAALVGVAIFEGWAYARFGSMDMGLRYLQGQRVALRSPVVDLGDVNGNVEQNAPFELVNLTNHPVRILGAKTDCSCIAPDGLPITIPPLVAVTLKARAHLVGHKSSFVFNVVFYTDLDEQPVLTGRLVGNCGSNGTAVVDVNKKAGN
jgi:hypothetical protein